MRWAKERLGIGGGKGGGTAAFRGEPRGKKAKTAGPASSYCPPTASRTRGRKKSPTLAQRAAVSWDLRDSTCWNTVRESQSAVDQVDGPTDGDIPSIGMP